MVTTRPRFLLVPRAVLVHYIDTTIIRHYLNSILTQLKILITLLCLFYYKINNANYNFEYYFTQTTLLCYYISDWQLFTLWETSVASIDK